MHLRKDGWHSLINEFALYRIVRMNLDSSCQSFHFILNFLQTRLYSWISVSFQFRFSASVLSIQSLEPKFHTQPKYYLIFSLAVYKRHCSRNSTVISYTFSNLPHSNSAGLIFLYLQFYHSNNCYILFHEKVAGKVISNSNRFREEQMGLIKD